MYFDFYLWKTHDSQSLMFITEHYLTLFSRILIEELEFVFSRYVDCSLRTCGWDGEMSCILLSIQCSCVFQIAPCRFNIASFVPPPPPAHSHWGERSSQLCRTRSHRCYVSVFCCVRIYQCRGLPLLYAEVCKYAYVNYSRKR